MTEHPKVFRMAAILSLAKEIRGSPEIFGSPGSCRPEHGRSALGLFPHRLRLAERPGARQNSATTQQLSVLILNNSHPTDFRGAPWDCGGKGQRVCQGDIYSLAVSRCLSNGMVVVCY